MYIYIYIYIYSYDIIYNVSFILIIYNIMYDPHTCHLSKPAVRRTYTQNTSTTTTTTNNNNNRNNDNNDNNRSVNSE